MKTKISIDILHDSICLNQIVGLIANNNSGKIDITAQDIITILKMERLKYPSIYESLKTEIPNPYTLLLFSVDKDNEKLLLTLTWKEVHELTETEADLVIQEKLS